MNNENITGNSEPEQNSVENISPSDFINRRSQEVEQPTEEVQGVAESSNEETSKGSNTDVLSNVDLDNMSESELKEIGQKLGTKAVARFGELTARRKQAEERMQRMEQELQGLKQQNKKQVPVVKDNPLKDVTDVKKLQSHNNSAREIIEWAEGVLDDHEDYKGHDVIADIDGKEYTKTEVKKTLRQSRDVVNKFVPAQAKELQKRNAVANDTKAFQRKVLQEFDWVKDKESTTAQRYKAMLSDTRVKKLSRTNPELSAQMPYLLAHAANSMFGRKPITDSNSTATKTGIKPPASKTSSAAQPERKQSNRSVAQKEVSERFKSSGSINDFVALRTLQKSQ
ncbi:MAG: hypothetical protein P8H35_00460 [Flavobacteriales bacterium]|jgi:hypothetical protein|nr:hypothetical protein [Flavobacteriales bacterium]